MIWLLWKLLTLPFRVVFGTLRISFKTVRFVGVSRILSFGAGVAAGMAMHPSTGTELRDRVGSRHRRVSAGAGDLAETVRYELAHSPRTWHLPQPEVGLEGSRVTLTGTVPHATGRADLVRTAGSVVGVTAVDNRLTIAEGPAGG